MDFPGNMEACDLKNSEKEMLEQCGAVIYVAHSRAENLKETSNQFNEFYKLMLELNPEVSMNIFFHQNDQDIYNEDRNNEATRILIESIESAIGPSANVNKNTPKTK